MKDSYSVAVFNCGYTTPKIQQTRGQYSDIFNALLQPAVSRVCKKLPSSDSAGPPELRLTGWDTVNQEYPSSLDGIDAIIITGSPNGAYEDIEWIQRLVHYVGDVYHKYPSLRLYGSCFGHQVICKVLYEKRGAIVQKDPAGWELGVHTVDIDERFAKHFSRFLSASESKSLRFQFLHGDHVLLPEGSVPEDICLVGTTPHCQFQGIYQPGRLLTYQGHPEFDEFIETMCLELVGDRVGWDTAFTQEAIEAARAPDDAAVVADTIAAFLMDVVQSD